MTMLAGFGDEYAAHGQVQVLGTDSRAAACPRRASRLAGSSRRTSGVSTGRSRPSTVFTRTAVFRGSLAATAR